MSRHSSSKKIHAFVGVALLAALVVVLQLFCVIPINPVVSITLSLVPIVIGAIVYGPVAGATLGAVLGMVIFVLVIQGLAGPLSTSMLNYSPIATFLVCILKTTLAGYLSGLLYRVISKKGHDTAGIITAALVCPVVNTSIFVTALLSIFYQITLEYSGEGTVFYFIIVGIVGINFLVEFAVNGILAPVILRVVKAVRAAKVIK